MTDPLGFAHHDHAGCCRAVLAAAEAHCAAAGVTLTPVRRRTLEILAESHVALGAYDILDRLAAENLGSKPPVAYRALSFLVDHGFAHRIERLNAFVACAHPDLTHAPAFLVCRNCRAVAETPAQPGQIARTAAASGFVIEQTVIEAEGLCPACQVAA